MCISTLLWTPVFLITVVIRGTNQGAWGLWRIYWRPYRQIWVHKVDYVLAPASWGSRSIHLSFQKGLRRIWAWMERCTQFLDLKGFSPHNKVFPQKYFGGQVEVWWTNPRNRHIHIQILVVVSKKKRLQNQNMVLITIENNRLRQKSSEVGLAISMFFILCWIPKLPVWFFLFLVFLVQHGRRGSCVHHFPTILGFPQIVT